jgi:hypothetical protein
MIPSAPTSLTSSIQLQEREKLARRVVDAINAQDWDLLRSISHADLKQQILPRSLGRPELNLDEWISRMTNDIAFIPDFKGTVEEVLAVSESAVCLHVRPSHSITRRCPEGGALRPPVRGRVSTESRTGMNISSSSTYARTNPERSKSPGSSRWSTVPSVKGSTPRYSSFDHPKACFPSYRPRIALTLESHSVLLREKVFSLA